MPERLLDLKIEDFAHPDDTAAMRSLTKIKALDKAMSAIEDKTYRLYLRMDTLGNCVRLTRDNAPDICAIVEDVCEILNYAPIPELYSTRSYKLDILPRGVDRPVLIIPDFILNRYDKALLYFDFGRAITRLKSGYMKFYTAALMIISVTDEVPFVSETVKLSFANWLRKSELTADRGGLLACQNYRAAMSFLMNKAGMPVQENRNVQITEYVESCKIDSQLVKFGKNIQTLTNCTGWANDRILELFNWNATGQYDELLERYLG